MAIIMLENVSTATKYEIPMIEFEGTWIEMFKERISRGCPLGNYVVRAISNYADVLCSYDSTGFRLFTSKIRYKKFAFQSVATNRSANRICQSSYFHIYLYILSSVYKIEI